VDKRNKKLIFILVVILVIYAFFSPIIQLFIPNVTYIGGMVTMDPFDDLMPFALSTFAPVDETRKFGSLPQDYNWDIVLDPTGASLANQPTYGIGGGDGTGACNCVPNEKRLGPMPSVSGRRAQIINAAAKIAQDLQPGFWCSYNHSPNLYPEYWNQSMFESNPCPEYSRGNGDPMAMFWCTYMVDAAHGLSFNNAAVTDIIETLSNDGRYTVIKGNTVPISRLKPGDIIFLKGDGHVAMVYSITSDGINTIESNAELVSTFIPTAGGCSGSSCLLGPYQALPISGFALLK
jgi:hypothetical protein